MAEEAKTDTAEKPQHAEMAETFAKIAEQSQRLVQGFLSRNAADNPGPVDPLNVGQAFMELTTRMMTDPAKLVQAQTELWQGYMNLWNTTARRMMGEDVEPVVQEARDDRRFRDDAWEENPVFDFIKQSYLLTSSWMVDTVQEVDGLDRKTADKVDFYTRQFVDAMAPTNFVMTNPEVLRETVDTHGENLVNGLKNLLDDLENGKGRFSVKHVDKDAFEVGVNIATSPGKVVFQTDLMQLLQFDARTDTVRKRPLVIVPPWINKFYILDLREKNSFIKWATEQGHTVFVVSWVNPDGKLADKSFDDYVTEGTLAAIGAALDATGADKVNLIGYCIGGTLTAATLAHMAQTGDDRVASVTYFTTMVDFEEAGELGVFIDEAQLEFLESRMDEKGYLDGADMATTFNMLRANDLIWSFVVNNYLMGKDPFPFDLLYWNADSTRMPKAMHSFYLRKMYQENLLVQPNALTLAGTPIDLTSIKVPTYILSTREDHIAPWKSTYKATGLYDGPVRFVLSASGHIAGVVNPPAGGKYCYWTNSKKSKDPEKWLEGAKQHDGSWWPDWDKWVGKFADGEVPARTPGDGKLKAIEDAPGSYVLMRTPEEDD